MSHQRRAEDAVMSAEQDVRPQATLTRAIADAIAHESRAHRYIRRVCRACDDLDARIVRAVEACRATVRRTPS